MTNQHRRSTLADFSLFCMTALWGLSFPLAKQWISFISPFEFITIRFGCAFLTLLFFSFYHFHKMNRYTLLHSLVIGGFLFLTLAFQTIGLTHTSASKSGFITSLCIVFVPLLEYALFRKQLKAKTYIGLVFAVIGLFFLTVSFSFHEPLNLNMGDLLTLVAAIFAALQIIWISYIGDRVDPHVSATIQMGTVACLGLVSSLCYESLPLFSTIPHWSNIILIGSLVTALPFLVQNIAQRYTTAFRASIIYTTEPVFALIFAGILLRETITIQHMFGALCILAGILTAEIGIVSKTLHKETSTTI